MNDKPEDILYRESVTPSFLEERTYLHGTTILSLFLAAVDARFDLSRALSCHLNRFKILVENDRQGEIVIANAGVQPAEADRIQAQMSIQVDEIPYDVWYVLGPTQIDSRQAYAESDTVGSYCIDSANVLSVGMKNWNGFEAWIRAIVATNKVFSEQLFGSRAYRWVYLSDLDLTPVLRAGSGSLVLEHINYKGGIGGKDYVVNRGHVSTPAGESAFDICFCA